MEETKFDALLRKAAEQTTRRATLGALLGGALLLTSQDESEATRRARRRRRRRRRQSRRQEPFDTNPIRVRVKNPGPPLSLQFVSLSHLWVTARWECENPQFKTIPTNGEEVFITKNPGRFLSNGFVWINETYSIEFWNLAFQTPSVSAAVNGVSMDRRVNCPNRGTRAVNDTGIPEGLTFNFKIYDKEFSVFRDKDSSDYKEFTLTLPTNL